MMPNSNRGRKPTVVKQITHLETRVESEELFQIYFTKHLQALIYLYLSRSSLIKNSIPSAAYTQIDQSRLSEHMKQRSTLERDFPSLTQAFDKYKEKYPSDEEGIQDMQKCVFLALSLKRNSSNEKDIWSQSSWGQDYYQKIVKVILEKIQLTHYNCLQSQKNRREFFTDLQQQVLDAIKENAHFIGIERMIKDEVYCFVASYYNFVDNERYVKEVNANHQKLDALKQAKKAKKAREAQEAREREAWEAQKTQHQP